MAPRAAHVIEQGYSSAPPRQLMRWSVSRQERAQTQQRSRVATTGRNTLKRQFPKLEEEAQPKLLNSLDPANFEMISKVQRRQI
jgi:hypothetical protein